MRRFIAVLSALALVAVVAGPTMAAKPGFSATLTSPDVTITGSYNGGFFIPTTGVKDTFVGLGITGVTGAPTTGYPYPFFLKASDSQKAALLAYFGAKGWPDPLMIQITAEINGTAPFFWLVNGSTIEDGLCTALPVCGSKVVRVDNDYPTGTFKYVNDDLSAQVKMKVHRA